MLLLMVKLSLSEDPENSYFCSSDPTSNFFDYKYLDCDFLMHSNQDDEESKGLPGWSWIILTSLIWSKLLEMSRMV